MYAHENVRQLQKMHFDDQLTTKHDQRKTYAHDVDFPECGGKIEFLHGQTIKANLT